MKVYTIDPGREVICDTCNVNWTDRPESGGIFGFSTKAICPECAPKILADAERYGEMKYLKARCPEGKSFADWVRDDLR
jgi:hypothetical protein